MEVGPKRATFRGRSMHRLSLAGSHEDLGHLARHMSSLMQRVLHSGFSPAGRSSDWTPAVDVSEAADRYEIVVELAGVRREDIQVFTENHFLSVAGRRGDPTCPDKMCVHQMEIEQGRFCRRLRLPDDADEAGVEARQRDGLLTITIPKRAAPPREDRP
ncbi:MAG: Hsp20/alpha crystallin family protein [Planctomycetes bacterium]|nr:Hsp20/alpha crystallin family protein [Planctomycetota bacterium]